MPRDAAIRETLEECGIDLRPYGAELAQFDMYAVTSMGVPHLMVAYGIRLCEDVEALVVAPHEMVEWRWVGAEHLAGLTLFGCTAEAIHDALWREFQPVTHTLKTEPRFLSDIEAGRKNFEVRKNDRHFRVGDVLELESTDPDCEILVHRAIGYILPGGEFGVWAGYCVLGLIPLPPSWPIPPVRKPSPA